MKTIDSAAMIEAAYLSGYEPSSDDLTGEALYNEATEFLYSLTFNS